MQLRGSDLPVADDVTRIFCRELQNRQAVEKRVPSVTKVGSVTYGPSIFGSYNHAFLNLNALYVYRHSILCVELQNSHHINIEIYTVIILSDNYHLPFPVALFIILTDQIHETSSTHSEAAA